MRWVAVAALLLSTGCGYQVAGRADLVPKRIKTIAIPAFENLTTRYKLSDRLPAALTREFLTRTRYQVVSDRNQADAVLSGAVMNVLTSPTVFDQATGRASGVQMTVYVRVSLVERETGAVLFSRPSMEVRQRYEISVDPEVYFEESEVALQRVSVEVARTVVSAVLENF